MRLAITRSFMMLSIALMAVLWPRNQKSECRLGMTVVLHEQLLDRNLAIDEVLLVHVAHQRLERRTVFLDAIRPRIIAEHFADFVELRRPERHHVAERAGGEH